MKTKFLMYKLVTPSFHIAVQYPESMRGQVLDTKFYPDAHLPSRYTDIVQTALVTSRVGSKLRFYWLRQKEDKSYA